MFNIGGGELLVIMLLALIVLGPKRLPDAARQIGKTMGDLKRLSNGFQNEMRSVLDSADDPDRVAARRNPLAKETPASEPAEGHPVRTEPLVAGPGLEPRTSDAAPTPPKAHPPSAQARAASKKKAAAKNGTPVKKTSTKAATAKKSASPSRRPKA